MRARHDGERSYARPMGIWRIWELQLDRKQTQQDAVDVDSGILKLEGEKSPIFSMSLQRMLSVNGRQGGKQPASFASPT